MPTESIHPAAYLLKSFVLWYVYRLSQRIVHFGLDLLIAVTLIVPFGFLLKSFLSPWKQIHDTTPTKPGLQLGAMLETITLGLTARLIGAFIRTLTILFGVVLLLVALTVIAFLFVVWLLLPIVLSGLLILAVIII